MLKYKPLKKTAVFYHFLCTNIALITIPVLLITFVAFTFSTKNILNNVINFQNTTTLEKQEQLDASVTNLDGVITQAIQIPVMLNIMFDRELYQKSNLDMREIIDYFHYIEETNKFVDSLYYIDTENNFVLSGSSKSSLKEFQDKYGIPFNFDTSINFFCNDALYDNNNNFFYIRRFNPISMNHDRYFVICINKNAFFQMILQKKSSDYLTIIYDQKNNVFAHTNFGNMFKSTTDLKQFLSFKNSYGIKTYGKQKYVIFRQASHNNGLNLMYVFNYNGLTSSAKLITTLLLTSSVVVILLSILLAYVYSIYLYRPLYKLRVQVQDTFNDKSQIPSNEYSVISTAVEMLTEQNQTMQNKLLKIQPIYEQYFASSILNEYGFSPILFNQNQEMFGITFSFSYYYVLFIDFSSKTIAPSNIKPLLNLFWDSYKENTTYFYSCTNEERILLLINSSFEYNDIYNILCKFKDFLLSNNYEVVLAISSYCEDIYGVSALVQSVRQQIESDTLINNHEIITTKPEIYSQDQNEPYSKTLNTQLTNEILYATKEKALETLDKITNSIKQNSTSMQYCRTVYLLLCKNLIDKVSEFGFNLQNKYSYSQIYNDIQKIKNIEEIDCYLNKLILNIFTVVGRANGKNATLIQTVVNFIEKNYNHEITMDEISASVYISTGYLSTLFKLETGMTMYDYITLIRMRKAAELLLSDPSKKVKDVASDVGYNNVQSFIRIFKKRYSTTPEQFRHKTIC